MKEKISIVIPTYNHCEDLLKPCVESIINKTQTEQYKVNLIIVANGCIDNTKEYINELKNRNLSINIFDIFEENPLGYTKAANLGIEFSRKLNSDYTILSNNDIILLDFGPVNLWIEMILKPFKDDQNVMITGPSKVINETLNLPFVIFFFVAIRNSIFDKIGTLDENFNPGFNEDVDFCARVLQEGYKIIRVPNDGSDFEYSTGFPIYHAAEKTVHSNESKLKTVFGLTWDEIKDRNNKYLKEKYNLQYSIVIPTTGNYNNKLDKCLDSMFKTFSETRKLEVIVVANGVDSETETYLNSRSDIKTIFEKEALGYIKATNLGLAQANGNYVILLNDDVEFPDQEKDEWLNRLKKPFLLDKKMGITGIKLLGSFFSQAEYLMFFCVMIKKETIDRIGLLDENLVPAFVEDEEYCVRAKLNGYNIADANDRMYTDSMLVLLHPSSTTYNNFEENKIQIKKNRYYLLNKYFPNRCVNIIVPTYKRYSELSEALRTIDNQTFDCIKTWVCSDGYDSKVKEIVDQFEKNSEHKQFNYLFLPEHEGLIGSKPRMFALDYVDNKGVVCFLDDDNVLFPTYIEKLFNAIRSDGNFKNDETFIANSNIISYCRIKHSHFQNPIPGFDHKVGIFEKGDIDSLNFMVNSYIAKICKNKWQHVKGNEITHDFDFISECSKFGKSVFVDEVLAEHKMSKNKIGGCNVEEEADVNLNQETIFTSLANDTTLTSYDEAKQDNRITIAYIHHNSEHLELFLQPSLDKLINRNFDLIILDDKDCPAYNYNKVIEQSKNDFILFMHEDVMFSVDFLDRIWETIFKYPNFGVLGFEGANHSKDLKQMQSYFWAIKESSTVLTTVDAAAFVINKKHNLKFDDRTFNDFHLFVEDYCLQVSRKLNLECRTVLINALESHCEPDLYENSFYIHKAQTCHSLGYNWGRFNEFFQKLIDKWQFEKKQKIYDCFMFYNELDVLEIRLNELYDIVDKFILVEATFTHSGKSKPLYFKENQQRFSKFLDKIEYLIIDEQPDINGEYVLSQSEKQWILERDVHMIRERFQRDFMKKALLQCDDNDIIIISDIDEIVSADAIKRYDISMGYCILEQRLFYYRLNCEIDVIWPKARIMPYSFIKDKFLSDVRYEEDFTAQSSLKNAGWHFSYLYSTAEGIADKIKSFCHQELNTPEIVDLNRIDNIVENAEDLYGRKHSMKYISIDETFPKFVVDKKQKFIEKNLIKAADKIDYEYLKSINREVFDEIFVLNVNTINSDDLKNATVFDIGANFGYFALKSLEYGANEIYCFEPENDNFQKLCELTKNKKNVKRFKKAVLDGSRSKVNIKKDGIASSIWGTEKDESVECISFVEAFSYLEDSSNKKLILKLDCEGSEFEIIFHTPIDILKKFEMIFLEIHDKMNPAFIDRSNDLLNYLAFIGFEVVSRGPQAGMWYSDGSFTPFPIYLYKLKNKDIKNIILPKQKIYDCFMFNDELDILDIRFQELNDIVDYFVIVESPITHSGKPKPLYFQENEKRYEKYLHKIRHYVYNPPQTDNPWVRENAQREALKDGLFDCSDYDIIISGDADEIPRKEIVKNFNIIKGPISVETKYFFYFLNCLRQEKGTTHLRIVPFWLIKFYGFCFFRYAKFNLIKNGGWHFSFIGDVKQIKKKFDSYAHQEYNNEYYTDENRLINMINNGEDILEKGMIFKFIEVDDDFPEFIKENKQNFIDRNLIKT